MSIERIQKLLETCGTEGSNFPPTDLYNEGWMLRIVLDWFSMNPGINHVLSFSSTDKWYSEALLPSAFLARVRGDKFAESWTHADGVIGDFVIGADRSKDLTLTKTASRFIVTEAKMFSKLSSGVKNASYFNQAARNVACIAEVIKRVQISPSSFEKIRFFVIAPETQIKDGIFAEMLTKNKLQEIVSRRVDAYEDPVKDRWFENWFLPTLEHIQVGELSWEEIIILINKLDPNQGQHIEKFYEKCIKFNQKKY